MSDSTSVSYTHLDVYKRQKPMFMSDLRETLMSALGQKPADAVQRLLPEKNADFKGKHLSLIHI